MKFRHLTAIAITAMALHSCDEDTGKIGSSLINDNDNFQVTYDQYNVLTGSYVPDSVYSYSEECYLGVVEDPETGSVLKSSFMVQFNMTEETDMPKESDVLGVEDGKAIADSCDIILFYDMTKTFGDTLTAMKIKVSELVKPVDDGIHYSSFDPRKEGYIREDGLKKLQTFTRINLNHSDSIRGLSTYYPYLQIKLNDPYTDKNGRTYKNYGTYIVRNYYEHPEYFKNSYTFIHSICPGFYFETIDGQGLMAKFDEIRLRVFMHYKSDTTTYVGYLSSASTEEVLQTITIKNDKAALRQLAEDNSCTYLKTPAGIFTEVTLPVDEIKQNHSTDSLLSASVYFNRINNEQSSSVFSFDVPKKVILIQKDSVNTFFEQSRNYNNKYAFYSSLSNNAYSFSNSSDISNLIVKMYNDKINGLTAERDSLLEIASTQEIAKINSEKSTWSVLSIEKQISYLRPLINRQSEITDWLIMHPDWNKALLIPVSELKASSSSSSYYSTSTSTVIGLVNEMGLTSTRLVKGTKENPIKIKVIYAKFND